jgi:hypothetical protein
MIGVEEVVKENNQTQFRLGILDTTGLRPKTKVGATDAVRALAPYEINVSGSQLLIGSGFALCAVGLLVWAFVRLWLFE